MQKNSHACVVLCGVVISTMVVQPAYAWWPIAHYEITKEAVGTDIATYAQLPDYVNSWQWFQWEGYDYEWFDITFGFCWSHGVQDAGETVPMPPIPGVAVKPTYPDPEDGRYPSPAMWELAQRKLKDLPPSIEAEMLKVAKGFRAHNAADRLVHFTYFGGPETGDSIPSAGWKWLTEPASFTVPIQRG